MITADQFLAVDFDPAKKYVVFMDASAIDYQDLVRIEFPDVDIRFVFVHPDGRPVADKVMAVESTPNTVFLAAHGTVDGGAMDGLRFVEVMTTAAVGHAVKVE